MAAFLPALKADFISLDDGLFVTRNPHVRSGLLWENVRWAFSNVEAANWHPLAWLSHMLDCQVFGLRPEGHHFTNVLVHSINGVLLFYVLVRATGSPWRSFSAASLFALHPLRVESVAWVAERKDVLCALFFLLTLLAYQKYAERSAPITSGAEGNKKRPKRDRDPSSPAGPAFQYYLLSLFLFIAALLSKPMAVTLPFVLLLLDYWPLRRLIAGQSQPVQANARTGQTPRPRIHSRVLVEKLPFFALSILVGIITLLGQHKAGAVTVEGLPLSARLGNGLVSYCRYLAKTIWPTNLSVFYPYTGLKPTLVAFSAMLLLFSTLMAFRFRKARPYLLTGWLWFCITLLPVSGIVQVGAQSMADRYTYLPSIGILILAVWSLSDFLARFRNPLPIPSTLLSLALLLCFVLTWRQLNYWKNSEILFRHSIAATTENWMAHCNLGIALNQQGKTKEAVTEFRESLKFNPDYSIARQNLGASLLTQGDTAEAIIHLQEAVKLKPDYALAHCNLGAAYRLSGNVDQALAEFQEAIKLRPADAESHYDLGIVLKAKGRGAEAIEQFQEALKYEPGFARARQSLEELQKQKSP